MDTTRDGESIQDKSADNQRYYSEEEVEALLVVARAAKYNQEEFYKFSVGRKYDEKAPEELNEALKEVEHLLD